MMNMGSSMSGGMMMVFMNSQNTPLYSTAWTPTSTASYAGTCIFLIILAIILRALIATKVIVELRWLSQARDRRTVVVKTPEVSRTNADPDAKAATLVTSQSSEEQAEAVRESGRIAVPFRLSVDLPRALLVFIIAGVSYLLMLAVMTMNVGYFFSVIGGIFVGELLVGRYGHWEDHLH